MWWCQHEHRIALALSGRGRDGDRPHRGANRPVQRGQADRLGGVITIGMDEHSTEARSERCQYVQGLLGQVDQALVQS